VPGLTLEVVREGDRTPVIFFGAGHQGGQHQTVLIYGHLDKQPEFNGWRADLGPGRPSSRTASSTAAAAPTTATPSMPPSAPSRP
jgi:acetylornithine deacetylase/succinyl-diaminopimelate desuccinylase-like protein